MTTLTRGRHPDPRAVRACHPTLRPRKPLVAEAIGSVRRSRGRSAPPSRPDPPETGKVTGASAALDLVHRVIGMQPGLGGPIRKGERLGRLARPGTPLR